MGSYFSSSRPNIPYSTLTHTRASILCCGDFPSLRLHDEKLRQQFSISTHFHGCPYHRVGATRNGHLEQVHVGNPNRKIVAVGGISVETLSGESDGYYVSIIDLDRQIPLGVCELYRQDFSTPTALACAAPPPPTSSSIQSILFVGGLHGQLARFHLPDLDKPYETPPTWKPCQFAHQTGTDGVAVRRILCVPEWSHSLFLAKHSQVVHCDFMSRDGAYSLRWKVEVGGDCYVSDLALGVEKKILVSASEDGTARIWTVEDFRRPVAVILRKQQEEGALEREQQHLFGVSQRDGPSPWRSMSCYLDDEDENMLLLGSNSGQVGVHDLRKLDAVVSSFRVSRFPVGCIRKVDKRRFVSGVCGLTLWDPFADADDGKKKVLRSKGGCVIRGICVVSADRGYDYVQRAEEKDQRRAFLLAHCRFNVNVVILGDSDEQQRKILRCWSWIDEGVVETDEWEIL